MDDPDELPELPFLNPIPWLFPTFNLEALPQELVNLVVNETDFETLLSLRLTNKVLCEHATPLLFRQISISYEEHSLQRLRSISKSSSTCFSVKDITYKLNDERRIHDERLEARGMRFSDTSPEVEQRRQRQQQYFREQQDEGAKGRFLEKMTKSFKSLPCLKTLDIVDDAQLVNFAQKGSDQMATVLVALAQSNLRLESFYIRGSVYHLGGNGGLFTTYIDIGYHFNLVFLEHLKILHLKLPNIYDTTHEKPSPKSLLTVAILQAANNLEEFYLELSNVYDDTDMEDIVSWEELVGKKKVGRLQKMEIYGWISSEASLTTFLKTSCREVRRITIWEARLLQGSWDSIIETIHHELHALEGAELGSLYCETRKYNFFMSEDDEDSKLLEDYLLGRVKGNPWQQIIRNQVDRFAAEDTPSEASDDEDAVGDWGGQMYF